MTASERDEALAALERMCQHQKDYGEYYERTYKAFDTLYHLRHRALERAIEATKQVEVEP